MGASVCEVARYPSSSMTKDVGASVDFFFSIKNCGNELGNFAYMITKNGTTKDSKYNHWLEPREKGDLLRADFTMPDSTVTLVFIAKISEGGAWVEKYRETATISPGVEYADFKIYVRDSNNHQPISGAKVVCSGVTKYTGSDGKTGSFNAEKYTTVSYTVSKSGYQTLTRSCYIDRDDDLCTPYLEPTCTCTAWTDGRCLRENYRAQTRTCTPSECDIEWREKYDPSCAGDPDVYVDFKVYVRDANNHQPISGAKVVCSGVTKYTNSSGYTDSFSAEKYTTVSYTVSKSGYQTLTRSCYIDRDDDLCTPYLEPACTCTPWVDGECLRENYRAQTRTCTPSECDIEWREKYDPSCTGDPDKPAKGQFVGDPTFPASKIVGERYNVTATGKNIGEEGGNFRLRLYEGATEISHGEMVYRGGGLSFTQTLSGMMPNRDINLTLKLMRVGRV